ncbi:MAG: AzlC family ABC transporter permease [Coriobacteriales bacterium]|nr:AzlC family ABC transporter permease [Coriobacteriales bacterium]
MAALPIVAGYIVLGVPCGILGAQAGMNLAQITLMSLLFYSGAGQYLIPAMWLAAAPIASIIASVSLVNTRQILYGASLSRFCEHAGKRLSFLFAATLTDESFGVNTERFANDRDWNLARATGVNLFAFVAWALATVIGALAGSLFSVPVALATFAMTSIFLCLLFMQAFSRPAIVAALTAAVGVLICKLLGLAGGAIFIGAVLGIGAAMVVSSGAGPGSGSGPGTEPGPGSGSGPGTNPDSGTDSEAGKGLRMLSEGDGDQGQTAKEPTP